LILILVRTVKDAHHALATLRDSKILFDLIISEFHIFGMNGFEFQKQIQDEFQLPVIGKYQLSLPNKN